MKHREAIIQFIVNYDFELSIQTQRNLTIKQRKRCWKLYDSKNSFILKVNQIGYRINDSKDFRTIRAVESFGIVNSDGEMVFKGVLSSPVSDASAGENVWKGDFSELKQSGRYKVRLENGEESYPFLIGSNIYYNSFYHTLRGLYVNRCGYEVLDDYIPHCLCHQKDGTHLVNRDEIIENDREVWGGWHNGGDYRRSTGSAAHTVARILNIYNMFPDFFDRCETHMKQTEEGAGLPGILAEAKWGLDWIARLQFEDGGVSIGLGPIKDLMAGFVFPQHDTLQNQLGMPYSYTTFVAGAAFAIAYSAFYKQDRLYAEKCLTRAKKCWDYLEKNPEPNCPDTCFTYQFKKDSDSRLWLAAELFKATGEPVYNNSFIRMYKEIKEKNGAYPSAPVSTQVIRFYCLHDAMISYCMVKKEGSDPNIRDEILAGLEKESNTMMKRISEHGYGSALVPDHWKCRHTAGAMLQDAWELIMAGKMLNKEEYIQGAQDQLHYILGRNPLGKVFVTGLGSNPVRFPHHRPSYAAGCTPPGMLVKGATHDMHFLTKYRKGCYLPPTEIYEHDDNIGGEPFYYKDFPENDIQLPAPAKTYIDDASAHQCNETDIEVQGYLIAVMGYFAFAI